MARLVSKFSSALLRDLKLLNIVSNAQVNQVAMFGLGQRRNVALDHQGDVFVALRCRRLKSLWVITQNPNLVEFHEPAALVDVEVVCNLKLNGEAKHSRLVFKHYRFSQIW